MKEQMPNGSNPQVDNADKIKHWEERRQNKASEAVNTAKSIESIAGVENDPVEGSFNLATSLRIAIFRAMQRDASERIARQFPKKEDQDLEYNNWEAWISSNWNILFDRVKEVELLLRQEIEKKQKIYLANVPDHGSSFNPIEEGKFTQWSVLANSLDEVIEQVQEQCHYDIKPEEITEITAEIKSIKEQLSLMAKKIINKGTMDDWTELENFINTIPSGYQLGSPYSDFINLLKQRLGANGNDAYGITVLQNTAQELDRLLESVAVNKVE